MNAIQTLKTARASAMKEFERAKKTHNKAENKLRVAAKEFEKAKADLTSSTSGLEAIDDAIEKMGGTVGASASAAAKTTLVKRGPKAKIAIKAAPGRKGARKGATRQAAGRREVAEGKRPPLKDAIAKVMGSKVMNADEVFAALKAREWLPNSNDPRGYIAYMLSATKDMFQRVREKGRGHYRVKGAVSNDPATKVEASETAEAGGTAEPTTDEILQSAGLAPGEAFGG